ncbi:MAG TPA: GAF domain-containing protein [Vicinamibacteria bacterium]|nr:GAF domain-containing protein [Vicinamibacteria bacterium]
MSDDSPLTLEAIRECLDGAIPSAVATCASDGTPNVTFVSQVHYVDCSHVALSFQFFSKTRDNVLANRRAVALVNHPVTAAKYRLELEYLRTETEGPLFENMKAKLAGIASHTGMAGIFRLRGSDVYRVLDISSVRGKILSLPEPQHNLLTALRVCSQRLAGSADFGRLLDDALGCLESLLDIRHSMVLVLDAAGSRLYTVASRGYQPSGVGSEVAIGCGVIGVAAEQRTPIRITHMTAEYSYGRAIRESIEREGLGERLETTIPLPGLAESRSQLAVPILTGERLFGVLYVESPEDLRFGYDDEDALVVLAAEIGIAMRQLEPAGESADRPAAVAGTPRAPLSGPPATVRHYPADDSVFIDGDYLIKGVAGAILCKLVSEYLRERRTEFTNRELRLDPTLRLPDIGDNLEARLILLERRLTERKAPLRIQKTGRGRFRLRVERPLSLTEMR